MPSRVCKTGCLKCACHWVFVKYASHKTKIVIQNNIFAKISIILNLRELIVTIGLSRLTEKGVNIAAKTHSVLFGSYFLDFCSV